MKGPLGHEGTSGVSYSPDKTTGRAASDNTVFMFHLVTNITFQMRRNSFKSSSVTKNTVTCKKITNILSFIKYYAQNSHYRQEYITGTLLTCKSLFLEAQ